MATVDGLPPYPARLEIDYAERRNRLTVAFRIILVVPIAILYFVFLGPSAAAASSSGDQVQSFSLAGGSGIAAATLLMILFRRRYPRWWFDFQLGLTRFGARMGSYLLLLVDEYPSTEDEQRIHLDLDYPNASEDLNRWLPLVKWILAIPHFIVLIVLALLAILATAFAWFAIIIVGRYPRGLFEFVVGVWRWWTRVAAYAFLLTTDRYPPFRLES